jgi:MFS superfamily sulfate permease-like transporter
MTANGHAANGADAPSKMPHKPWRDDEEDANSLRAIVRANFPRSVDDAFPFLRVARTMTRDDLKNDLVAGLTVAVMVIPQGMAYAALASLRPEIGLYSCILPILTYALVGSSRQLAVGPVAMVALLTTAGLSPIQDPLEDPDRYQRLASTLAFLVGIMQAGMGLLRLEFIARFLPHPVLSGFTSAAAVVIGSSQIKDGEFLFGYFWLFLVIFGYFWLFPYGQCE